MQATERAHGDICLATATGQLPGVGKSPDSHELPRLRRRYTTGRNVQLNIKATASTVQRIGELADEMGVPLGVVLARALDALTARSTANSVVRPMWPREPRAPAADTTEPGPQTWVTGWRRCSEVAARTTRTSDASGGRNDRASSQDENAPGLDAKAPPGWPQVRVKTRCVVLPPTGLRVDRQQRQHAACVDAIAGLLRSHQHVRGVVRACDEIDNSCRRGIGFHDVAHNSRTRNDRLA